MKQIALTALLAAFIISSQAQVKADTTGAMANLNKSSKKMLSFFLAKNFTEYVNFIHPKIVEMFGGKDKMMSTLLTSMDQMKKQGFEIKNITIGNIKPIIVSSGELQSVVPQILELKITDGRLVSTGYLIGISDDRGKTWHFIDTGGKTLKQVQTAFPGLDNRLVIPAKEQPSVYKN